jgi:prepilin-type processing-associated H-X9-DG protein
MTQANDGHTTMLFYFDGSIPVIATLVVPAEVLTPTGTSLSVISSQVPQITTAPGSEDLAILGLQMTIGPRHIVYYKRVHGHSVPYHPAGLAIPEVCPRGGFVFGGNFSFADGSVVHNTAAVPCPAQTAARRGGRGGRRK